MSNNQMTKVASQSDAGKSALDQFLETLGKRINNPVHRRLLKVARSDNPSSELEDELQAIISEIINEDKTT